MDLILWTAVFFWMKAAGCIRCCKHESMRSSHDEPEWNRFHHSFHRWTLDLTYFTETKRWLKTNVAPQLRFPLTNICDAWLIAKYHKIQLESIRCILVLMILSRQPAISKDLKTIVLCFITADWWSILCSYKKNRTVGSCCSPFTLICNSLVEKPVATLLAPIQALVIVKSRPLWAPSRNSACMCARASVLPLNGLSHKPDTAARHTQIAFLYRHCYHVCNTLFLISVNW